MRRISRGLKWMAAAVLAACMVLVFLDGMRGMQENIETAANIPAEERIDSVDAFKTLRQQLRAMEKAQLNDVAHGEDGTSEVAQMARRQLVELCEREEQELTLEGVLSLRGYENPVVTVHADSVNVLLQTEAVGRQESSTILELVCRETGVQSGNVKIIPIN